MDDINVNMGTYYIECDKDLVLWRITERDTGDTAEFDDLTDLLRWLRHYLDTIEIEQEEV